MTRLNLKSAVDILSPAAVLIGLVFVGFELRQNTAAVEAASRQSANEGSVAWLLTFGTDPSLAQLWVKASKDLEDLSETESMQLYFLIRSQWVRFETSYLQWKNGVLSDVDWSAYSSAICRTDSGSDGDASATNLRTLTWEDHQAALNRQFVDFVEGCRGNPAKKTD